MGIALIIVAALVFAGCDTSETDGAAGAGADATADATSEIAPPPYSIPVITDDQQSLIEESLALLQEFYDEDHPGHFLILVGDSEDLVDDMSCDDHDQATVEKMLQGGTPRFLHLVPAEGLSESNAAVVDEEGRALSQKYLEAPQHIKDVIDYVNEFAGHEGALDDEDGFLFNYSSDDGEIFNGTCQNLGTHHLGLFKDSPVVVDMNAAVYVGAVRGFGHALQRRGLTVSISPVAHADSERQVASHRAFPMAFLQPYTADEHPALVAAKASASCRLCNAPLLT